MTTAVASQRAVAHDIAQLAALRVYARKRAQASVQAEPYPTPTLRGAALDMWHSTDHEAILAGAAETGKTYACLHKLHMLMLKHPGAQAAIVRKTYSSLHGTALQTFRRILGKDTTVHSFGGEKPEWFDYPNGSRVFVGGMDNPQKVLSSERDLIYVNQAEELELGDWETLTTRCTGRGGVMPFAQIYGDCNPGPATHWLLNRPSLKLLYSHHEDNPTLFDDTGNQTEQGRKTLAVLDALTGVRHKRLRLGLWVGAEGMVYEDWNRETHLVDDAQLQEWGILTEEGKPNHANLQAVIGGVDWGFTNPGVLAVWAVDKDGRVYLLREWYMTGKTIDWWIERGIEARDWWGIRLFVCDPAEPAYIRQLNVAKLGAIGGKNDIAPGIQALQARLKTQGDGRARLYVRRDHLAERDPRREASHLPCGFVEEIEGYVWTKSKEGGAEKEEPVKHNDHSCDQARYVSMHLSRMGGRAA